MAADSSCFHFSEWFQLGTVSKPLYIAMMVINCTTILPASILNALIVITVLKSPSLRVSPSMVIVCNIALSDLVVGIVAQPIFVAWITFEFIGKTDSCTLSVSFGLSSTLFAGVSLLSITTSSIDRFLALHFHLRYLVVVTSRRVSTTCAITWLIGFLVSLLWIPFGFIIFSRVLVISMAVCLLITLYCYAIVFKTLRRHQLQIQDQQIHSKQQSVGSSLPTNYVQNLKRFKKSVFSGLSIFGAFLGCYLPLFCTLVAMALKGYSLSLVMSLKFSVTVVFVNSALNPLLFLWKVSDLRLMLRNTLSKWFLRDNPSSGATQNTVHTRAT